MYYEKFDDCFALDSANEAQLGPEDLLIMEQDATDDYWSELAECVGKLLSVVAATDNEQEKPTQTYDRA